MFACPWAHLEIELHGELVPVPVANDIENGLLLADVQGAWERARLRQTGSLTIKFGRKGTRSKATAFAEVQSGCLQHISSSSAAESHVG